MYNTSKISSFWHDSKWIIRFSSHYIRCQGSGLSYIKSIIELTQDDRVTHYFRNGKNGIFNSISHIVTMISDTECFNEIACDNGKTFIGSILKSEFGGLNFDCKFWLINRWWYRCVWYKITSFNLKGNNRLFLNSSIWPGFCI